MLTSNEEKYLSKIPEDKIVRIFPYDSGVVDAVEDVRQKLKSAGVNHDVYWIGASALGIAGQNDLDLHISSNHSEWAELSKKVSVVFGKRVSNISIYKWEFKIDGFEVELYLSDLQSEGMKTQLQVFKTLQSSETLRKEYEKLKLQFNGKSFRDYMRAKYEFFHGVLGE